MAKGAQDDSTVYLVKEEMTLLSPALKKQWEKSLKPEALTAYETPEQIDARMKAVNYSKYPKLQKKIDACLAAMQEGKQTEMSFEDFPEEAISSFLYSIGASGISAYIDLFLSSKKMQGSDAAMQGVAALSRARHRILEKNQAVFA